MLRHHVVQLFLPFYIYSYTTRSRTITATILHHILHTKQSVTEKKTLYGKIKMLLPVYSILHVMLFYLNFHTGQVRVNSKNVGSAYIKR